MLGSTGGPVRIGELSRRTGVSPELLRAWESRYGLLRPMRSDGGYRLYTAADERRVRQMTSLIATGLSAAQAAARSLQGAPEVTAPDGPLVAELAGRLDEALAGFDAVGAHDALDRLLAAVSVEQLIAQILIPYLHGLGARWERGEVSVAQEHFASNLIRGRLLGLARDWSAGDGPLYVLACPPGEEHDLALIMFGIALSRRGARVLFLGADTPIETLTDTVRAQRPAGVALAVTEPERLRAVLPELPLLSSIAPVWVCGPGVSALPAGGGAAELLPGDPVAAARALV
ncbi:MAG TPA: MerR family transcriptional regulator [Actinomycetota bacterium]|nr:MerR family transcriptional regulator [Actinomycetota bacterium]